MTAFNYYRKERMRHNDAAIANLQTFENAVAASRALFAHFGQPEIPVRLRPDRSGVQAWSFFKWHRAWGKLDASIEYHPRMINVLTVAHEVAHYIDLMRKAPWDNYRVRLRKHGTDHALLVDEGVMVLRNHPIFRKFFEAPSMGVVPAPTPPVPTIIPVTTPAAYEPQALYKKMVADYFETLPEKLTCACCGATIPKSNFGVRVMKKNEMGLPAVMRPQSYCKSCR